MSGDTEEKNLPPSEQKLRKAREKGQVASSQDFVGGLVLTAAVFYMFFNWQALYQMPIALFDLSIFSMQKSDPEQGLAVFLTLVLELGAVMIPLMIMMIVAGIAANLVHKRGIPFSMEPIKPDFKKINPGEGLKKLFSKRNASEFGVSFVRLVIWFVVTGIFLWLFLPGLIATLTCRSACALDIANALTILILATAVILLIVTGLLDLPMQVMLFQHEQKMSHKELKKEQKDMLGAPEFRQYRRREHQRMVEGESAGAEGGGTGNVSDGLDGMSIVIRGFDRAIGIYFHSEHCTVPKLVKKFNAQNLPRDIQAAERKGITVIQDGPLTNDIAKSVTMGDFVKQRHFERVARYLVQAGIIG